MVRREIAPTSQALRVAFSRLFREPMLSESTSFGSRWGIYEMSSSKVYDPLGKRATLSLSCRIRTARLRGSGTVTLSVKRASPKLGVERCSSPREQKGQKHDLRDQPVLALRHRRVRVLPPSSGCKPLRTMPDMSFRATICGDQTEIEVAL